MNNQSPKRHSLSLFILLPWIIIIPGNYDPYNDNLDNNFDNAEINTQKLLLESGDLWIDALSASDREEKGDNDSYVSPVRNTFASLVVLFRNKKLDEIFLTLDITGL